MGKGKEKKGNKAVRLLSQEDGTMGTGQENLRKKERVEVEEDGESTGPAAGFWHGTASLCSVWVRPRQWHILESQHLEGEAGLSLVLFSEILFQKQAKGLRDVSETKSQSCSCKGPEFSFQHPHWAVPAPGYPVPISCTDTFTTNTQICFTSRQTADFALSLTPRTAGGRVEVEKQLGIVGVPVT